MFHQLSWPSILHRLSGIAVPVPVVVQAFHSKTVFHINMDVWFERNVLLLYSGWKIEAEFKAWKILIYTSYFSVDIFPLCTLIIFSSPIFLDNIFFLVKVMFRYYCSFVLPTSSWFSFLMESVVGLNPNFASCWIDNLILKCIFSLNHLKARWRPTIQIYYSVSGFAERRDVVIVPKPLIIKEKQFSLFISTVKKYSFPWEF